MSLVHMDFPSGQTGLYGTDRSYMLNGLYAETSNFSLSDDPDPNITGNVVNISNTSTNGTWVVYRYALPGGATTKAGVGLRIWLASLPVSDTVGPYIVQFCDVSNNVLASMRVLSNGRIRVTPTGGSNYDTTTPVIVANAWQHVEISFDTAGVSTVDFEVRVEGVTVLDETGVVGSDTAIGQIRVQGQNSGSTIGPRWYNKDLVIWDGAGSVNNTFLGSVVVRELLTDGDVSFLWAASSGSTGYNLLNEAPPNDNTDYIYAIDPPPGASLFSLTDLPADVTSVKGLYAVVRSTKTDGGDGNLQVGIKSGASTGLGSDRPITTAYTYWTDVFELDPATSAAWTRVGVNAAQLQLNRTV